MALSLTFNVSSSVPSNLSRIGRFFERPCRTEENTIGSDNDSRKKVVSKVVCEGNDKDSSNKDEKVKGLEKMRSKRPARLVLPEIFGDEFCEKSRKVERSSEEEFEIRGRGFSVASKKGRRREFMEDNYGVLLDIMEDPKQAFFTVIDGHGGRAAADYVAENLGKNIAKKFEEYLEVEEAVREGYLDTDKGFLSKGENSGACAASVIVKSGNLFVANVGDCRVVISRNGVAHSLTKDHRLTREDERFRIENSGGFVHCNTNGVWRVQGSLAVSRAMGDQHLKQWVISEPEIETLPLTPDCKFLIIASDGLWDKVSEQEAVDVVAREIERNSEHCKKLVEMSSNRGNMDDITVMVVNLESFSG